MELVLWAWSNVARKQELTKAESWWLFSLQ